MFKIKKILKKKLVQSVICSICWYYIWLVYFTTKWRVTGLKKNQELAAATGGMIIALWHDRLFMAAPFAPKNCKINVVISNHNDGELISKVMLNFKFSLIRGSSKRRDSLKAFNQVKNALNNNEVVIITPDGPRGPRHEITGNIVEISHKYNAPIIPVTYAVSNAKILNSWDRFILALPFSKGIFIYGKPIYPSKDYNAATIKQARIDLENNLNALCDKADKAVRR